MNPSKLVRTPCICLATLFLASCGAEAPPAVTIDPLASVAPRPEIYAEFTLTADLSDLTDDQREMLGILIEASEIMDDLYWRQAFGDDYEAWLASVGVGAAGRFADLNYGPWDRLDDERPFIEGVAPK